MIIPAPNNSKPRNRLLQFENNKKVDSALLGYQDVSLISVIFIFDAHFILDCLAFCMLGKILISFAVICSFSKFTFSKKIFQEHLQSVKGFGSRSGSGLGLNFFEKAITR